MSYSHHDIMVGAQYLGAVVRLAPDSLIDEIDLEPGMLGLIVRVDVETHDVFRFYIDTRPFTDHNDTLLVSNYYDKDGNAVLNAKEAGHWHDIADYYIGPVSLISSRLEILGKIETAGIHQWVENRNTCLSIPATPKAFMEHGRFPIDDGLAQAAVAIAFP